MTLYIIYTPNSVKYLIHFLPSLLKYSTYKFCLVSNGCALKERAILQKTAASSERISYYCYPTNQMQIHGKVLTHLQARCQEEYFCFMDSDIFATAPLPDLKKIMEREQLTGLFSAMPIWVKRSEYIFKPHFQQMLGTFNQMQNGTCIGSTYFAIYKNAALNEIIQHYGVCFDECARSSLPIDIQAELHRLGYHQTTFDTGKVINLLLNKHKFALKNIEIDELCHIGGTSYETTYQQNEGKKEKLKKQLLNSVFRSIVAPILANRKEQSVKKRFKNAPKEEYLINLNQRALHRNITRQHFLNLYLALMKRQKEAKYPIPPVPQFKDEEINQNIKKLHNDYIFNFANDFNAQTS